MSCKFLLALACVVLAMPLSAASSAESVAVDINYTYNGDHGIDFSALRGDSLELVAFVDRRDGDAHALTETARSQQPVAAIVGDAFRQAFAAGDAPLVNGDGSLKFSGEVLETNATVTDDASLQLTIKTLVKLSNANGKTLWQNTLLGRASVPQSEGIAAAAHKALDRLIEELMFDDYFLMQAVQ